jgi:hypothetical protein
LIAGPDGIHARVLAARQNLFYTGIVAFALMVLIGARRKSLAFSATLGTLMIPIVFHPANYYIHFIFVLPMLAAELADSKKGGALWPARPSDSTIWIVLLLLCAAEYGVAIEKDLGLHFYLSSALLIVAVAAILIGTLVKDFGLAAQTVPVEAGAPSAPPASDEPKRASEPELPSEPIAAEAGAARSPDANDEAPAEAPAEPTRPD